MYPRHSRRRHVLRRQPRLYVLPLLIIVTVTLVLAGITAVIVWARDDGSGHTTAVRRASRSQLAKRVRHQPAGSRQHQRAAGPQFVAHPQPVVILVYHHIARSERGTQLLYVSPAEFTAQIAYLSHHGYQAVTLQQVYNAWTGGPALPARAIVLSFDDGYVSQSSFAAVVLRRYHWPAVLNLIVNNLSPHTRFSAAMVRSLLASGWELDSHTVTHRPLTLLSARVARHELVASRAYFRRSFDVPVNFFCYPGGDYNRAVERAVKQAGYLAATSTDFSAATPAHLFALGRVYCYWGEPLAVFASRLHEALAIGEHQLGRWQARPRQSGHPT
jgi:peptidoglycan/xylan/chitin deacetylase (PgdA/CDA1 family)